jgi:hypothetical protein
MVVHSSNPSVMHESFTPAGGRMIATFHAQAFDLEVVSMIGTFLAKRPLMHDSGFLRRQLRAPCTELSTLCVDKDKNPFEPAACDRFLADDTEIGCKSRLLSMGRAQGALLQ